MIGAIDPGPERSAYVVLRPDGGLLEHSILGNDNLIDCLVMDSVRPELLAIEEIASYGMPVGREVFSTCWWSGRFVQAWGGAYKMIPRRDVKLHLCGSVRANDATIRHALIDRYGGKVAALGTKDKPGPLRGLKRDLWSALALAITASEAK